MLKRPRFLIVLFSLLLITCGGDKKDEDGDKTDDDVKADKSKDENASGGSAESSSADGTGKSRSLLGGIFSGKAAGGAMSRIDLSTAFGTALPTMQPAADPVAGSSAGATSSHTFKGTEASKALWDLAPADAAFGFVVAEGTGQELVAVMTELERILGARPSGAALEALIRAGTGGDAFNIFKASEFASAAGLDLSKGFAMFMTSNQIPLMVLPITDVEKFRAAVQAKPGELNDTLCPAHGVYRVCSEDAAYAQAAIAAHQSPLADRVSALPKWLRGDMEVVAHLPSFEGAKEMRDKLGVMMTDVGTLALAARMEGGAMSMRMWLEGKRGGQFGGVFSNAPTASLTGENAGAINWFHMRLPSDLLALAKMPATIPMGNGLDLRRDLVDNLTGEVVAYSRGDMFFSEQITLALTNGGPTAKLVQGVCPFLKEIGLQKPRAGKGSCSGTIDLGKALAKNPALAPFVEGMPPLDLHVAVVGNNLEIKLGGVQGPSKTAADNAGNAVTRELLTGNWNIVQWGMALDPIASAPDVLAARIQTMLIDPLEPEAKTMVDALRWLYGHTYDAGFAIALRDDGLYAIAEVTTMAGDPAEAQRAHEAGVTKLLDGDIPGYRAAMLALAKAHPTTLAANQARNLDNGAPILGQFGVLGALVALSQMKKKDEGGAGDEVASMVEGIARDLCQCKDKACGAKAFAAFGKLIQANADMSTPDQTTIERVSDASMKMNKCAGALGMTPQEIQAAMGM